MEPPRSLIGWLDIELAGYSNRSSTASKREEVGVKQLAQALALLLSRNDYAIDVQKPVEVTRKPLVVRAVVRTTFPKGQKERVNRRAALDDAVIGGLGVKALEARKRQRTEELLRLCVESQDLREVGGARVPQLHLVPDA